VPSPGHPQAGPPGSAQAGPLRSRCGPGLLARRTPPARLLR
jgi:hypothetical protein